MDRLVYHKDDSVSSNYLTSVQDPGQDHRIEGCILNLHIPITLYNMISGIKEFFLGRFQWNVHTSGF